MAETPEGAQTVCSWILPSGGSMLLLVVSLLLILSPRGANAAGTPAGTTISNRASVTFRHSGTSSTTTANSNVVNVIVAQVAVVNVHPVSAGGSAHLNSSIDYPITITNSGNGTDRIAITVNSSLDLSAGVFHDVDGNGVLSPAEVAAGPATETRELRADSSSACVVRVSVPGTMSLIGQTDGLTLAAVSLFDTTKRAVGQRSTTITGAILSLSKSVNITLAHVGDRVTYTIPYENNGNAMATGCTVSDVLDSRLRYVTNSATPAPDSLSGQRLTWDLRSLPTGARGTIVFQVEIAANAVPGAEIHNIAAVRYEDGPNTRVATSREDAFITIQNGARITVDVGPIHNETREPGDLVQYAYVVTNNGLLPETFDLSTTSTQHLLWTLHKDANGNGRTDPGESATTTTGVIPAGGQCFLVARTILPMVPDDLTLDLMVLRVASTTNSDNVRTVTSTTTIAIPRMTLVKSASAPDPRSGNEITYSITYANEGHGQALGFVVTDTAPSHTTYVPGSARVNGAERTDQADGDELTVIGNTITAQLGTMMPGSRGTIEFRVRIH